MYVLTISDILGTQLVVSSGPLRTVVDELAGLVEDAPTYEMLRHSFRKVDGAYAVFRHAPVLHTSPVLVTIIWEQLKNMTSNLNL